MQANRAAVVTYKHQVLDVALDIQKNMASGGNTQAVAASGNQETLVKRKKSSHSSNKDIAALSTSSIEVAESVSHISIPNGNDSSIPVGELQTAVVDQPASAVGSRKSIGSKSEKSKKSAKAGDAAAGGGKSGGSAGNNSSSNGNTTGNASIKDGNDGGGGVNTPRQRKDIKQPVLSLSLARSIEFLNAQGDDNPFPPPLLPRSKGHWDYLMDEVQWMAIDFRQELRWKISQSKVVAELCVDKVKSKLAADVRSSNINVLAATKALASKISTMIANHWNNVEADVADKIKKYSFIANTSTISRIDSHSCSGNTYLLSPLVRLRSINSDSTTTNNISSSSSSSSSSATASNSYDAHASYTSTEDIVNKLLQSLSTHPKDMHDRIRTLNSYNMLNTYQTTGFHHIYSLNYQYNCGAIISGFEHVGKTTLVSSVIDNWIESSNASYALTSSVGESKHDTNTLVVCSSSHVIKWLRALKHVCCSRKVYVWKYDYPCDSNGTEDSTSRVSNSVIHFDNSILIVAVELLDSFLTSSNTSTVEPTVLSAFHSVVIDNRRISSACTSVRSMDDKHWLSSLSEHVSNTLLRRVMITHDSVVDQADYCGVVPFLMPSIHNRSSSHWLSQCKKGIIAAQKPFDLMKRLNYCLTSIEKVESTAAVVSEEVHPIAMTSSLATKYHILLSLLIKQGVFTGDSLSSTAMGLVLLNRLCFHEELITVSVSVGGNDTDVIGTDLISINNSLYRSPTVLFVFKSDTIGSKLTALPSLLTLHRDSNVIVLVETIEEQVLTRRFLEETDCCPGGLLSGIDSSDCYDGISTILIDNYLSSRSAAGHSPTSMAAAVMVARRSHLLSQAFLHDADVIITISSSYACRSDEVASIKAGRTHKDLSIIHVVMKDSVEAHVSHTCDGSIVSLKGQDVLALHNVYIDSKQAYDTATKSIILGNVAVPTTISDSSTVSSDRDSPLYKIKKLYDEFHDTLSQHRQQPSVFKDINGIIHACNTHFKHTVTNTSIIGAIAAATTPRSQTKNRSTHTGTSMSSGASASQYVVNYEYVAIVVQGLLIKAYMNDEAIVKRHIDMLLYKVLHMVHACKCSVDESHELSLFSCQDMLQTSTLTDSDRQRLHSFGYGNTPAEEMLSLLNMQSMHESDDEKCSYAFVETVSMLKRRGIMVDSCIHVNALQTSLSAEVMPHPSWMQSKNSMDSELNVMYLTKSCKAKNRSIAAAAVAAKANSDGATTATQVANNKKRSIDDANGSIATTPTSAAASQSVKPKRTLEAISMTSAGPVESSTALEVACISRPTGLSALPSTTRNVKSIALPKANSSSSSSSSSGIDDDNLELWTDYEDSVIIACSICYTDSSYMLTEYILNMYPYTFGRIRSQRQIEERHLLLQSQGKIDRTAPNVANIISILTNSGDVDDTPDEAMDVEAVVVDDTVDASTQQQRSIHLYDPNHQDSQRVVSSIVYFSDSSSDNRATMFTGDISLIVPAAQPDSIQLYNSLQIAEALRSVPQQ